MAMKESTKTVWRFLQENDGNDYTAPDVANATGLSVRQVNGAFTMAIQKKNENKYGYREEATVKDGEGQKVVKFLRLTDEGKYFDLDAETAPEKE